MTTTATPSITAALHQASLHFGQVSKFLPQPNGWGYTTWSEDHRAWWSPQIGCSYNAAVSRRAWDIAAEAARITLVATDADDETLFDVEAWAEQLADDSAGLPPHDRVRQLLNKASA